MVNMNPHLNFDEGVLSNNNLILNNNVFFNYVDDNSITDYISTLNGIRTAEENTN